MKVCKVDGCGKRAKSRGWCSTHYNRWRAHGDPLIVLAVGRKARPVCAADGCLIKVNVEGSLCSHHEVRMSRQVVSCGVCGALCGRLPVDGDPWAVFGAHRCRRAS